MAKSSAATKTKEATNATSSKRKRREIEVVSCPSDFPISSRNLGTKSPGPRASREQNSLGVQGDNAADGASTRRPKQRLLDWRDTAKEIRSLGATSFVGQEKRNFQEEQYEKLTGRTKKKHSVPLPIARGIKKAAEKRLARQIQEAKESGTILPKSMNKKKKKAVDNTARIHGPAPSVGFMKKGVLKVHKPV
jgi:Domain of unknown function (DUF4602)